MVAVGEIERGASALAGRPTSPLSFPALARRFQQHQHLVPRRPSRSNSYVRRGRESACVVARWRPGGDEAGAREPATPAQAKPCDRRKAAAGSSAPRGSIRVGGAKGTERRRPTSWRTRWLSHSELREPAGESSSWSTRSTAAGRRASRRRLRGGGARSFGAPRVRRELMRHSTWARRSSLQSDTTRRRRREGKTMRIASRRARLSPPDPPEPAARPFAALARRFARAWGRSDRRGLSKRSSTLLLQRSLGQTSP